MAIDESLFSTGKPLSDSEVKDILKSVYDIKKETMLTYIIDNLYNNTFDPHCKDMFARIKNTIRNDQKLQSTVVDVDAFMEEFYNMLNKESFSPFFTEKNVIKYRKIVNDMGKKYMGTSIGYIREYLFNVKASMWLEPMNQ